MVTQNTPASNDQLPDYANWVPRGMVIGFAAGSVALAGCALAAKAAKAPRYVAATIAAAAAGTGAAALYTAALYQAFSYKGKRKLSKQIVEGTAAYVDLPEGGVCLDVGCGSGALAIAVAKRNPQARVIGVDRWGAEYASFSKDLCERNAAAEGVSNTSFMPGDATELPFVDESFDAVTSNYVYHNVTGANKQELLRETLRCLKKGGTFAIHDIISPMRYGDMEQFCQSLRDEGYQDVRMIPTDNGLFMSKLEGTLLSLSGSSLLVGTK